MPRPRKPKVVAKILLRHGFELIRQKGSHSFFRHTDGRTVVVPMHNRDIPKGTLQHIGKQTNIDFDAE